MGFGMFEFLQIEFLYEGPIINFLYEDYSIHFRRNFHFRTLNLHQKKDKEWKKSPTK